MSLHRSYGFYCAFWRQPEAYLDPRVRAGISIFSRVDPRELEDAVARLREDRGSGRWQGRHRDLLDAQSSTSATGS